MENRGRNAEYIKKTGVAVATPVFILNSVTASVLGKSRNNVSEGCLVLEQVVETLNKRNILVSGDIAILLASDLDALFASASGNLKSDRIFGMVKQKTCRDTDSDVRGCAALLTYQLECAAKSVACGQLTLGVATYSEYVVDKQRIFKSDIRFSTNSSSSSVGTLCLFASARADSMSARVSIYLISPSQAISEISS